MTPPTQKPHEKGQALAETALFSVMVVLLALGILALIPIHRVRTLATSAAYACAQFVSQSRDPIQAVSQAKFVARRTFAADWSGSFGAEYEVEAWSAGSGDSGCSVTYRAPLLFNGLLGFSSPGWQSVEFSARTEAWKAEWP